MTKTEKNSAKNKMLQQYLSPSTNYAICIDITSLHAYGELFLAVDIAARNIVGHCYSKEPIETVNVCETIKQLVRKRSFLPKIVLIHSDRGSLFNNKNYYLCLQQLNIERSRGSAKAHENQVIERLNRSIKEIIRKKISPSWDKKSEDPLKHACYSIEQMSSIVQQAIEQYNQRPHSAIYGLTPNEMEDALFQQHRDKHPDNLALITSNNGSTEAKLVNEYKKQVVLKYAGNWLHFFLDWQENQERNHREIIHKIETTAKRAQEEAQFQYQTLYEQYLEVQKQIEFLHQKGLEEEKYKQEKEERKLKKKNAQKKDLRETVNPKDFFYILSLIKGRKGTKERRRIAILLLYLTGLRVSNLLVLNVNHAMELFEKGNTTVPIIKGGEKRFHLRLSSKGKKLLIPFREDLDCLIQGKTRDMPLFTSTKDLTKAVSRESFDRELNFILNIASIMLEKHIRTHSFRATFITELLKTTPIDQVKEAIGHKNISTTLEYKRSRLSVRELDRILARRELIPSKNKKKRIKDITDNEKG